MFLLFLIKIIVELDFKISKYQVFQKYIIYNIVKYLYFEIINIVVLLNPINNIVFLSFMTF